MENLCRAVSRTRRGALPLCGLHLHRKALNLLEVWSRSRSSRVVQLTRSHWSGRAYIGFLFACSPALQSARYLALPE